MKKIFIAFGHHNINSSFNAEIRDTFIDEAKKCGHTIDLINLFTQIFHHLETKRKKQFILLFHKKMIPHEKNSGKFAQYIKEI